MVFSAAFAILVLPSALSSPEYAWAVESNALFEQIQEMMATPVIIPDHWDPTLAAIVLNEVERHQVSGNDWIKHTDQFINMVRHIESDNKQMAYNPSGAMSYFQFKSESIKTAHNRLLNYLKRHETVAEVPRWSVGLYYNPKNIYNTPKDQQALLMIINIIEQDQERGTDYFTQFLHGDLEAGVTAYYKYHHTNPDPFTTNRTERLFAYHFD